MLAVILIAQCTSVVVPSFVMITVGRRNPGESTYIKFSKKSDKMACYDWRCFRESPNTLLLKRHGEMGGRWVLWE